jgi:hypothetical protein
MRGEELVQDMEAPIIRDKSRGKYDNEEVISFIIEKKNEGKSGVVIADLLKQRGYEKIDPSLVQELYRIGIARSVTFHNTAQEQFTDFTEQLKESYNDSIQLMGELVKTLRLYVQEIKETDVGSLEGKSLIIKTIPLAVNIMKEIREHVKLQSDLQDKIITTAQEEVKLTSSDVMNTVRDYSEKIMKELKRKEKEAEALEEKQGNV